MCFREIVFNLYYMKVLIVKLLISVLLSIMFIITIVSKIT